jgi:hypothetical protein
MELTYVVEHHIPIPSDHKISGNIRWPLKQMGVNDSIWFPVRRKLVSDAARYYRQKFAMRFACRTERNGTRVWRTQ